MFIQSKVGVDFVDSPPTATSYLVCSTPRCGSSLMCEALVNSGLAGAPTEFFDDRLKARFCKTWNIDSSDQYLAMLLEKKTGPNAVFGAKVHYNQYSVTFGVDQLPTSLPGLRFIWIQRKNVIEQAVSYARAIQTDKWSSVQPGNDREPVYQFDQISSLITRVQTEQSNWADFFRRHSIEPLQLSYEEFSGDLIGATFDCLSYLGVRRTAELSIEPLTLRKQADPLTAEWIEQFENDLASNDATNQFDFDGKR